MTISELNAEVLRNLSIVAEKQKDPTLMTEEEFFARVEEAEEQYRQGQYSTLMPGETVEDMLKRSGDEIFNGDK